MTLSQLADEQEGTSNDGSLVEIEDVSPAMETLVSDGNTEDTNGVDLNEFDDTPIIYNTGSNSVFYEGLYSRLLIQKDWNPVNGNLINYIGSIVSRINSLRSKGKDVSRYLMWNKDKKSALLNSALLDKFGKNILFISEAYKKGDDTYLSFVNVSLVDSKKMLYDNGFENLSSVGDIECVPFYDNSVSELVFDARISDFDLENWHSLSHCIIDRKERFPEPWCNYSTEQLCQDIINAIELGISISKYDSGYIKPFYSRSRGKIQFIIPYHVGNNFQEAPELGIIVDKTKYGFWQVMTILEYSQAYTNIKSLSLYSDSSF